MKDRRTWLQKARGIKPSDVENLDLPTENEDWFYDKADKVYYDDDKIAKSYNGKEAGVDDPNGFQVLGYFDIEDKRQGYARKVSRSVPRNVIATLRAYSNNSIVTSIINTRINQVTNFAQPADTAQDGVGYRVRLVNGEKPTPSQQDNIDSCMRFLRYMGRGYDPARDDFKTFLRKLVRDSLIYDQVPMERIYATPEGTPFKSDILDHVKLLDATGFVYLTDRNGNRKRTGKVYGQVVEDKLVAKFDTKELGVFIRNKSTDIVTYGYGRSELESALREIFAQENTEQFNDRFFTNGGTVRGILNVKTASQPGRVALDNFKRTWRSGLTGIPGSWSIPMVTADDIQFINLTPTAQDMQFEKWFNYLTNVICAIYCIDPSEIGMTNRGGTTGSKSNSLNESNNKDKIATSKDKGLTPLLKLIANFITNEIIYRLVGKDYIFEFVGGDIANRMQETALDIQKLNSYVTVNEIRKSRGLKSIGAVGDIIESGVLIQHIGQIQQQQMMKSQEQQQLLQLLDQHIQEVVTQPDAPNISNLSYQDMQAGLDGKQANPSGKENQTGTGKDGQAKNVENTNSAGQGGKNHKKK